MSKIAVFDKRSGALVLRAWDSPEGISLEGVLSKSLGCFKKVDELSEFFGDISDRILVKDEGIDTEAQPSAPDPNAIQVASEDIRDRVEPALKIIREILARAEQKHRDQIEILANEQALALEQQNAQAIPTHEGQFYVTMDGDGIGNQVARAQYTDDELKVREVSSRIDQGKEAFIQWAVSFSGVVIEAGGDEGQVKVPSPALEHIEEFRKTYLKQVGATVTVGVGKTISQSIQARELGKLRGKNQVVYWEENTPKELELRMAQKGKETPETKLAESGVLSDAKLGQQPQAPGRPDKYGLPEGEFEANVKRQTEYESWLRSQKKEIA